MATIYCLFFIVFFYGICLFALVCDGGKKRLLLLFENFSFKDRVLIRLIIIAVLLLTFYWLKQNRFVYYWDYSAYWAISINRMEYMFSNSFKDIFVSLIDSVNYDDYNCLLPTIIALPMKLFGYSFVKYSLINAIFFLIPVILIHGLIAVKLQADPGKRNYNSIVFIIGIFISACMPSNYISLLRGYIDIAFLIPASIAMYLFVDYDYKRVNISRDIAIALMLVLCWLCRRYVVFYIIGYVFAMLVKGGFVLVEDRSLKTVKSIFLNLGIIGGVSLGLLLVFFRRFLLNSLLTNYGKMYSAYDAPLIDKIDSLGNTFGYFYLFIIVSTGILYLINKKKNINYYCALVMIITECFAFWQTQHMGVQHFMILNIPIFVLSILCLELRKIEENSNKNYFNRIISCICAVLLTINIFIVFSPNNSKTYTNKIFAEKYTPLIRYDIDTLRSLAFELNNLTYGTNEYVYVLASGTTLNCDVLRKLNMPETDSAVNNLLNTHDVDLRDGFPTEFLHAKYVVVTEPIQLHLSSGQEVVKYLAEKILDTQSFIGIHYTKLDEFIIDNGIKAILLVKTSDYSENDLQLIRDNYSAIYPDYSNLFVDKIA